MTFNQKLIFMILIHIGFTCYALVINFDIYLILMGLFLAKLFNLLGHEIGMHRLWSHNSFETTKYKEYLLHIFYFPMLFGSTIVYAGVHRDHHANTDTDKDPHLKSNFERLFYKRRSDYKISVKSVHDLIKQPIHKFLHKNYFLINVVILIVCLFILGPIYLGYTLSFIVSYGWFGGLMVNSAGHNPKFGYRNFDTNDKSTNSYLLQLGMPGTGLHNNHHAYPGKYNYAMKGREFDIPAIIIEKFFIKHG